jgi:hypothetical protein
MNRRIFTVLCLAALLFGVAPANAEGFSAAAGIYSDFVVDNGTLVQDGLTLQGSADWGFKSGAYFSLWASTGGRGETDLTAGWANRYLDLSVAYFDDAGGSDENIVQTAVKATYPVKIGFHTLGPYAEFNTISVLASEGDSGRFWRIGLQHSWKRGEVLTVTHGGYLLRDSGIFRGEEGLVARYEAGLQVKRGAYVLKPALRVSVPVSVDDREEQVVAVFAVSR